jgi:hypothetical protein
MSKLVKGKKALLLAEGCKLNKQKKEIENRLKEIKTEIDFKIPNTYRNEAGDELVLSETERFTDVLPEDVRSYLKKNRLGKHFFGCVKVNITSLKKVMPETVINAYRKPLDSVMRFTWK